MGTHSHALLLSFFVLFASALATEPPAQVAGTELPACAGADIVFDMSSIQEIFQRPEDVLADTERFWSEDGAYRLAKQWHEWNNIPIPFDTWRQDLERIVILSAAERSAHPVYSLSKTLAESHDDFIKQALPHICSCLPDTNVGLSTTVYFTAYTRARSFMMDDNIVLNIMHPYYHNDRLHILNAIVHEIFHLGYGRNPTSQKLAKQTDDRFYRLRRQLQNEGMATYVAHEAAAMYPAAGEKDYPLLANPADVVELRRKLNEFFEQATVLSDDDLQRTSWDVGITQRAYYVVGADMSRTIDAKAGRSALVETITKGPRSFVATYNALVAASERIPELP